MDILPVVREAAWLPGSPTRRSGFIRSVVVTLGIVFLSGCASPCRHFAFRQIEPGIYAGCRPRTPTDFNALRQCGVRRILSFETFFWHTAPERRLAWRNGIAFERVPIFASPLGPSERRIKEALLALHNASRRPLYVHCLYGRDRTAVVIALYRIYFENWSPEQAWQEMLKWGFKRDWSLWGFERYFWFHTEKPDWVRAQESIKSPVPSSKLDFHLSATGSAELLGSPGRND